MLVTGGSCIPLLGVRNQYRAGGGGYLIFLFLLSRSFFLASGCTGVRLFSRFRDSSLSFLIASHIRVVSYGVVSWNLTAPPIAFPSSSLGFVLIPTPLIQLLPHLVFATSPPALISLHFQNQIPVFPSPVSSLVTCYIVFVFVKLYVCSTCVYV